MLNVGIEVFGVSMLIKGVAGVALAYGVAGVLVKGVRFSRLSGKTLPRDIFTYSGKSDGVQFSLSPIAREGVREGVIVVFVAGVPR